MSGEVAALLSALVWAISSVLFTAGARRLHVLPLNVVRCVVSTTFFWVLLPFYGGWKAVAAIPPSSWLWLVLSVLGLLVIGDTLYFRALELAGASWAMPVAGVNPLWAVLLASFFVDEPLTWSLLASALLVVAGVALLSKSSGKGQGTEEPVSPEQGHMERSFARRWRGAARGLVLVSTPAGEASPGNPTGSVNSASQAGTTDLPSRSKGLLLALAVSVLWALGILALKPATEGIDSIVANSVRQPLGLLFLSALTLARGRWRDLKGLDLRSWAVILVGSFIGTGFGTWFFVIAVQEAGSGRTAVLTSLSPVMAVPFAMLFLGERPDRWTFLGTLLAVAGIALVA